MILRDKLVRQKRIFTILFLQKSLTFITPTIPQSWYFYEKLLSYIWEENINKMGKRFIWLLFILNINCYAQKKSTFVIDNLFKYGQTDEYLKYIEDQNEAFSIQEVFKLRNFKPYHQEVLIFGGKTSAMWLKLEVNNQREDEDDLIMDVSCITLDGANVFIQTDSLKIYELPQVNRRALIQNRPIPSNKFLFKLALQPHKKYTLFIKIPPKVERHRVSIFLWDEHEYTGVNLKNQIIFFISIGSLLLAILVSIFLYFFLKEKIYWQYSLYMLSLVTIILVLAGYLDPYLLTLPFLQYFNTYTLIGFFCIGVHVAFTHNYLCTRQYSSKWVLLIGKIIIGISYLLMGIHFLPFHSIHHILPQLFHLLLATAEIYIFGNIINGIRNNHKPSIVYFIRFVPYIIGSIPFMFNVSVLSYLYQIVDSLLIASIFEMLFLAVGLGFSYAETLKIQKVLLHELSQTQFQILQAQETERNRIAQDLHDEVGNSLAALKNLVVHSNPDLSHKINKIAQDVRDISHNLASIDFDKTTLSSAFQNLIHRQNEAQVIVYELIEIGTSKQLSPDKSLVVYRIACELLNNIQKHSKAKKAIVQLIYEFDMLTLMVEDDGVGIYTKENKSKGIGMNHIHTRVAYLNGRLTIDDDGKGTVTIVNVPV